MGVARNNTLSAGFPIFRLVQALITDFFSHHGIRRDGLLGGNTPGRDTGFS